MSEIIPVEPKVASYFVMIFPTECQFGHKTEKERVILITDIEKKTYIYPANIDPLKETIPFLVFASRTNSIFASMLERAYKEHTDLLIGEKTIPWIEYEMIFEDAPFYIPPVKADIRTTRKENRPDKEEDLKDAQT